MEKEPILLLFGHNVQQARKKQEISQEKLAELAGVHRTYIGMIVDSKVDFRQSGFEKGASGRPFQR